jgi:hypothetical protein
MELNDVAGKSMTAALRVDSLGGEHAPIRAPSAGTDSCDKGIPRIRSIVPNTVDITSGDLAPIVITGCAFAPVNTLRIGTVTFSAVPSAERGTVIRFVVPLVLPSSSEVPPRRMPTGSMDVTVTTTVASSNRVVLTLR